MTDKSKNSEKGNEEDMANDSVDSDANESSEAKESDSLDSGASDKTSESKAAELPEKVKQKRSSAIENVGKTLSYISEISEDKSLSYRDSDRKTTNFLGVALICAVVFAALPSLQLTSIAMVSYLIADIFLILAISGFVITRFGVIRAMEPRYALVSWHLMVGTGLLALTIGFNFVVAIVVILKYDKIASIFGG